MVTAGKNSVPADIENAMAFSTLDSKIILLCKGRIGNVMKIEESCEYLCWVC